MATMIGAPNGATIGAPNGATNGAMPVGVG